MIEKMPLALCVGSVDDRAHSPAVRLHNLRLPTGEDFPVLYWRAGCQTRLPTRYAFHLRRKGIAESTLRRVMLRLAELYSLWSSRHSEDLDERLTDSFPVASMMNELLSDSSLSGIEGALRNERITYWGHFLMWASDPRRWCYVRPDSDFASAHRREERLVEAEDVVAALLDEKTHLGGRRRVNEALHPDELEALEAVLLHGAQAEANMYSGNARETMRMVAQTTARRDWLLYAAQRYLGVRVGEALKICEEDLPLPELVQERFIRRQLGRNLILRVRRRASDPSDPRRRGAVKRANRTVAIAEALADQFWHYRDLLPVDVRSETKYVFVSERCRPLSISRAEEIAQRTARNASKWFERKYPNRTHTLADFRWHRLRHTRAHEAVKLFFPDGKSSPDRLKQFLDYFGWSTEQSAWPYIATLDSAAAEAMLHADDARLRVASQSSGLHELSHAD